MEVDTNWNYKLTQSVCTEIGEHADKVHCSIILKKMCCVINSMPVRTTDCS